MLKSCIKKFSHTCQLCFLKMLNFVAHCYLSVQKVSCKIENEKHNRQRSKWKKYT